VSLADTVDCARILVEVARALSRRAPARESMF
jgi:hypothetical protein